ncbi:MAG: HEAT repeat domain-containing protein [Bryobacteraceae bacterium]
MRVCFLVLSACLVLCGQTVRDRAWDVLKVGVADNNPAKRVRAITAISSLGPATKPVSMLEASLLDKDPGVRQTAAALLGEMRARRSIAKLRQAIDDDDPAVSFTAAHSLWEMGDRTGRKLFEEVLLGDRKQGPGLVQGAMRDARARLRNPSALAMMGVKEASGALLGPASLGIDVAQEIMKDKGAPGRTLSVALLSESCDSQGRDLMEAVLDTDRNWGVRVAAARALGRCGNAATVTRLEALLADPHDDVRMMAAASIVRLTGAKTRPVRAKAPDAHR